MSRTIRVCPQVVWAIGVWASVVTTAAAKEPVLAPISQRMEEFVADGTISGAVTLVAKDGQIVHLDAVGMADLEHQRSMQTDSLCAIASMTKPITATAVLILQDDGKLSVEDRVDKWIPGFADAKTKDDEPVRGLTIRHLLTHTSGLGGRQDTAESLQATAEELAGRPFDFQPGDRWQYGPSMNVAARIIEIASGQAYERFLAERIFRPLAMTDTTFHLSPPQLERRAEMYARSEDGQSLVVGERPPFAIGAADSVPNPSGGLFSTAENMFRFYQMILGGGQWDGTRIVSADAVRAMTSVQTGELRTGFTPGNGWGLGWCIIRRPEDVTGMLSPGSYGHGGLFGTQGWVDPERGMIFVLMIQRLGLPNSDGSQIRKAFQQAAVDHAAR